LCVVSLVAGDVDLHRRRKKTEKKKTFPIHVLLPSSAAAARGATRRYCFGGPRMHPRTIPEFFGLHFVNLKLLNVLFVLF
jgi:hypothetical protein